MVFLGIETSCDETAAALIKGRDILGHVIYSQDHTASGGVIPQNAARQHMEILPQLVTNLFQKANLSPQNLGGIGVTAGPGLVAGLLVGIVFAKGLALSAQKPLWPIHHLEAHSLMARMTHDVPFPFLLLLLSGGHCLLAAVKGIGSYAILGQTYDDAAGECIDKVARALGGPYPGGPYIETLAQEGDPSAIPLPIPLQKERTCNFSFSGLKTACLQWIRKNPDMSPQLKKDFAASFQYVIAQTLAQRLDYALSVSNLTRCVLAGGVAANAYFRQQCLHTCTKHNVDFVVPPPGYCTDNGLMIAWAVQERYHAGIPATPYFQARPSWPLDQLTSSS